MKNSLIVIITLGLVVFSLSAQPYLPNWLHPLQLWLVFPLVLLTISVRHSLLVALITGWLLSIYFYSAFPTQYVIIIPASCTISFLLTNSWRTHRIWLLVLTCTLIGSIAYILLTYGVFFSYSLLTQSNVTDIFAPTAWSYLLLGIAENVFFALVSYRFVQMLWPDRMQARNPLTGTHAFTT